MSSAYDVVEGLLPNYREERRMRNKIRSQCRKLLKGLDRGGMFELIDTEERELCYLSQEAEKYCVEAEDVLKQNCSRPRKHSIRFAPSELDNEAKQRVSECLNKAIEEINKQNKWSRWAERGLIGFIVIVLGASVFIGIIGLESMVELI